MAKILRLYTLHGDCPVPSAVEAINGRAVAEFLVGIQTVPRTAWYSLELAFVLPESLVPALDEAMWPLVVQSGAFMAEKRRALNDLAYGEAFDGSPRD